ncbi:diablo IAP-binding mitochondrial protein isoform X2 [Spea bombifrons]|uniref:diablo IAP-binding mitochondrial protein isoform X2 n=1 Tax=Spea bombifrons TaxID=233779 RepID=UPI002349BD5C|nr:diablo IAP-binding mitochondrial protein isoform X2 [Spea bombifrons]
MAAVSRRLIWGFSSLLRQSLPFVPRGTCIRILRSPWLKMIPVGVGTSLCAVPVGQRSEPTLSNESLIKRAASLLTDSTQTFLSQTTYALIDSLTEYTTAVYTLISLQQRYTALLDRMNPNEESTIWQMKNLKEQYLRYESSWERALSLSEMAAEAAYQAGADQASVTVRNHIQLVRSQVQETLELVLKAEAQLAAAVTEEIRRTVTEDNDDKPAGGGSPNSSQSEEEIPEAYLRED